MKFLLIALTLTVSAQTFADCSLPQKKDFISADKIVCDNETNQVLLEGIKIKRFDEEKSALADGRSSYEFRRSVNNICKSFGLSSAESVEVKTIYSYFASGIALKETYDYNIQKDVIKLVELKQTGHIGPVKSIVCNR